MPFRRLRCRKKNGGEAIQEAVGTAQLGDTSPTEHIAQPPATQPSPTPEKPERTNPVQGPQSPRLKEQSPRDAVQGPTTSSCNDFSMHLDISLNDELAPLWLMIHDRVKDLARREGKSVNGNLDIEDVLANLDNKEPGKTEKAKKYFNNTLTAVQKVGGFVVSAASQVFAPAADCYNAINFMIDAYKGYQGAFDGLGELLEECTDYLDRLPYYAEGKMDAKLTKVAGLQLDLFVRVCDAALELRYSKAQKVKMAFKVMFLADDGIQPLLGEMAKLVNKERNLVQAQTFLSSKQAADAAQEGLDATKRVEGYVSEMHAKDKEADREKVIKKALGFGGEPAAIWRIRYREYLSDRLPDTGQWIFEEPVFKSWERGESKSNILAIEGGSGSGKSFLASAIIQHLLHKKSIKEADPRVCTAYYFFEGDSREAVKNAANLETAAKSIVWQFTQVERRYKKSVARICSESPDVDPSAISSDLLFENSDLPEMNVVFYIVIDGLSGKMGEGMLRFLRRASTVKPGRCTRVLMTVDSECSQHLESVDDISFQSIPISKNNRADVERLIRSRMDSMLALSDKTRNDIADLRAKVCNDLYEATGGDYFQINLALDDISKREYVSDIMNALNNARSGRTAQIKNEIEGLNQHCSETGISEINEIILWVRRYRETLTEKVMTAALHAKGGESSLLALSDKIKDKYSLFKITKKNEVAFRAQGVEESIPTKRRSQIQSQEQGPDAVSSGEMAMVKHFLSTVCPQETYQKLNFDKFLEQKRQNQIKNLIYKDDVHIEEAKMALSCLRLLTGETDQSTRDVLLPYARNNFTKHLSAVNLALVDVDLKSKFGPYLVSLFSDDTSIDILLNNNELPGPSTVQRRLGRELVLDDAVSELILKWLNDEAVTLEVRERVREWVSGETRSKRHQALLEPAAKRMATHLVQEPHFLPLTKDAYQFVADFLDKFDDGVEQRKLGDIKQIEHVERWCEVLKVQKNSLWHTQIGSVFQLHGHKQLAENRARLALRLDHANWRASTLLSGLVDASEGIKILLSASQSLESSDKWKETSLERLGLAKMLYILAELSWRQEQTDAAISFWERAVEVDFTDYGRIITCINSYAQRGRWSELIAILRKIDALSTEQLQGLSEMIAVAGGRAFPHGKVLHAALHTKELEFIVCAYERSVQLVEERGDERATLCTVRYNCGRAANALQNGSSRAIKQWRQAFDGASSYQISTLISSIAPYYVQKAIASAPDTEAVSACLEQIETLLPEGVPETESLLPPRVYIARYHKRQDDIAQAKRITRDIVQLSLSILSDDDEGNDLPAYNQLLSVFIMMGDLPNVLATRALMVLLFGEEEVIICDGGCSRSWHITEETLWCQDCINAHFDEECRQKILQGRLPFSTCNTTHQFLRVPRMDESLKSTPKGVVPFGDDLISFEAWLAHIEENYVKVKG